MLLSELQKLAEEGELVSIERDCHDEELTGLISDLSDSLVAMQLFANEGEYQGFAVFEFDQISEVFWGNREHKAIRHLVDARQIPKRIEFKSTDFVSVMAELNQNHTSLCLHLANDEDRYDIAHIESFDENWSKILTYSPMRSLSRTYKMIRTDLITRIVVDSPYQKSIVELHARDDLIE